MGLRVWVSLLIALPQLKRIIQFYFDCLKKGSPDDFNLDTIGKPLPGTETLIINKDENGHGEVSRRFINFNRCCCDDSNLFHRY